VFEEGEKVGAVDCKVDDAALEEVEADHGYLNLFKVLVGR
jgi:hypothetical protein